ncbi:Nucleolar complex protein 2 [Nymphon striatum]|nr:Nucleolar complex protein 2 [Nymphon striatum]
MVMSKHKLGKEPAKTAMSKRQKRSNDHEEMEKIMQENMEDSLSDQETHETDSSDNEMDSKSYHKIALKKLKDTDPKFHKYLQENDEQLLQFSDDDDDDDDISEEKNEKFHKLPEKLEVASDDSEASDDEDQSASHLTVGKINKWRKQLVNSPGVPLIRVVISAFEAAVTDASGNDSTKEKNVAVHGSSVFNAITKICLCDLQPAIHKVMRLPWPLSSRKSIDPKRSKAWLKLKKCIKIYLTSIIKILSVVTDSSASSAVLKHIHQMTPFLAALPKFSKLSLKTFIKLWSTAEESVRILAFLCIMAICRDHTEVLDFVLKLIFDPEEEKANSSFEMKNDFEKLNLSYFGLNLNGNLLFFSEKQMYMSYVRNSKFTSPTSWPLISFMKRTLVEVYVLDEVLAYQHAFVYIRQLAIHLRNAITIKKTDSMQSVYNWQFVHCILLWTQLLSDLSNSEVLKPLIYPLVQTVIGTIKLIPTQKYLPLRFQCIRALTTLSDKTNTFIPVIPFIMEVLEIIDVHKHHSNVSFKPMDFTCTLKLSKKQLSENGFKDRAIDQVYETMMDYTHTQSYKIGYPELVLPATVQLKSFLKLCKIANYSKQLKQMMDKIIENSMFVTEKRKGFSSSISDQSVVELWESELKKIGTPIDKFYENWRRMKDQEIAHSVVSKKKEKEVEDHKLPKMLKHKKELRKKVEGKRKTGELFSESEDDSDFLPIEADDYDMDET